MAARISHDEETLYEPVFHDRSSGKSSSISSTPDLLKGYKPWNTNHRRAHILHMIIVCYFLPVWTVVFLIVYFTFPSYEGHCARPNMSTGLSTLAESWRQPGDGLDTIRSMPPGELTRGIIPMRCHSHNDDWRKAPLFEALAAGCTSIEAAIWPNENHTSPLISHTLRSTHPSRTLQTLYIDPITALLEHQTPPNTTRASVFAADATASLVLLLDFKSRSPALWAAVQAQLQPLRDRGWLTHWDPARGVRVPRAVTVVASGAAPFDAVVAARQRDVFFDAPLGSLDARYDGSNSYYASVSVGGAVGPVGWWGLWPSQRAKLGGQIGKAAERGLVARYWGVPTMPLFRRGAVWKGLLGLGVGVLDGDDVGCMAEVLSDRLVWERA